MARPEQKVKVVGHTRLIMAIDAQHFLPKERHGELDAFRNTPEFIRYVQKLPHTMAHNDHFRTVSAPIATTEADDVEMDAELLGYAMGLFRYRLLETHHAPVYQVSKEGMEFEPELLTNLQFKKLFLPEWRQWDITIRLTPLGFFIVSLTREYKTATLLLNVATDVVTLQSPFDLASAIGWLHELEGSANPEQQRRAQSIHHFLNWLHVDPDAPPPLLYSPVHWHIALEALRRFTELLPPVTLNGNHSSSLLNWCPAEHSLTPPFYDSYVNFFFERLYIPPETAPEEASLTSTEMKIVDAKDVRQNPELCGLLASLLEGAILKRPGKNPKITKQSTRLLPRYRADLSEEIFKADTATWEDEICLITSRTTLVIPSDFARSQQLFISDLPTPTSKVTYQQYWRAFEHLLETGVEIQALAQLVENYSTQALEEVVKVMRRKQEGLMRVGEFAMERELLAHLTGATTRYSRLLAIAQEMAEPHLISRAEYGVEKFQRLVEVMGTQRLLSYAERNITTLSDMVNHFDDIFQAETAAKVDRLVNWGSLMLAGVSLLFLVFTLPSFWLDTWQFAEATSITPVDVVGRIQQGQLLFLSRLGNALAIFTALIVILVISILSIGLFRKWLRGRW